MVILDTSIIIDHLRQIPKPGADTQLTQIIEKYGSDETVCISIISIQELYHGKSTKSIDEEQKILQVIAPLSVLAYNYEIAEYAGKIARDLTTRLEFADAAIAATAILSEAPLATLNTKDFTQIPDLKLLD